MGSWTHHRSGPAGRALSPHRRAPATTATLTARDQIGEVGGWAGARAHFPGSLDVSGHADPLEVYLDHLYTYEYGNGPSSLGGGWDAFNALTGPGELTGDGKGDLLARSSGGTLCLYRGDGRSYGFAGRTGLGSGWNAYNALAGAGDLTGDGRADLLAVTPSGTLYRYAATHTGTANPFATRANLGTGWNTYTQFH
ncbi:MULTISPECIES: FG-GAP repeat domain-containing protein [Streptomyces]|uniref:VCBS repeat-containing protein n=2 Tax=Streptomyces TaxID=1883 RepID=A0A117IXI0_9ACTN|nr:MULTISPECIES: VCBS repeat-containing protein [Streptomyces]KUH39772.1 hypothetical protein ATE80_05400 [Streptomyces kanasensis]UUS34516.1 VCBS repeat-containing protein [Streptomyces changanensis]